MEECLAIKLLTSLFKLMFFPNYSIALKKATSNEVSTKVNIGCNFLISRKSRFIPFSAR